MTEKSENTILEWTPLRRYLLLYVSFFRITALVVGGGLAMLPVIEETFVNRYKLLTKEELLDMVTLTQTIPGIIAMNSAVFVGMKVGGIPGALSAIAGAFTPPFFIILLIASCFPRLNPDNKYLLGAFAGVRACVTGLILVSACKMCRSAIKCKFEILVVAVYFILALCKVNPALLIFSAMPLGCLYLHITLRRKAAAEASLKTKSPDSEKEA